MLNENIKTLRKNKGFTQEELASHLHVTRQTISKWEKGLSVPDAEMLSRMAEVLNVSVAELLGAERVEPEQMDAVVEQLCRINEQLAIRNRRSKRIWKTIITLVIILVVLPTIITIAGAVAFVGVWNSQETSGSPTGTTEFTCVIDGEEHEYMVMYDEDYNILSYGDGEDDYFDERIDFSDCEDAYQWAEKLEDYVIEHGGEIHATEAREFPLEGYGFEE